MDKRCRGDDNDADESIRSDISDDHGQETLVVAAPLTGLPPVPTPP